MRKRREKREKREWGEKREVVKGEKKNDEPSVMSGKLRQVSRAHGRGDEYVASWCCTVSLSLVPAPVSHGPSWYPTHASCHTGFGSSAPTGWKPWGATGPPP